MWEGKEKQRGEPNLVNRPDHQEANTTINPLSFRAFHLPFSHFPTINQFTFATFPSGVFAITLNTSKRTFSQ
jgi:hypothetical protein